MSNLVAIVGRPNVGKSTLFNRLTQTRQAIVDDVAGTTRDRQYGKCEWGNRIFSVVDTGGWVVNSDDVFEEEIRKQVGIAIEEADLILFLVDIKNGVTDLDDEVAGILRRSKTPVILVTNKMDTFDLQYAAAEFYRLGLGDPVSISAANGSGTGELLDLIVSKLPVEADAETDENIPRFAVVVSASSSGAAPVESVACSLAFNVGSPVVMMFCGLNSRRPLNLAICTQ